MSQSNFLTFPLVGVGRWSGWAPVVVGLGFLSPGGAVFFFFLVFWRFLIPFVGAEGWRSGGLCLLLVPGGGPPRPRLGVCLWLVLDVYSVDQRRLVVPTPVTLCAILPRCQCGKRKKLDAGCGSLPPVS